MPIITGGSSGGGSSSAALVKRVGLSSADILALGGAAKSLVAAPGAGLALWPYYAALFVTDGSAQYSSSAGLHVGWGGLGSPFVDTPGLAFGDDATDINAGGVGQMVVWRFVPVVSGSNAASIVNAPLTLDNDGVSFTSGNGTAVLQVGYSIITF